MARKIVFLKLERILENTYLNMRKLRLRKVKRLTQGHNAS